MSTILFMTILIITTMVDIMTTTTVLITHIINTMSSVIETTTINIINIITTSLISIKDIITLEDDVSILAISVSIKKYSKEEIYGNQKNRK